MHVDSLELFRLPLADSQPAGRGALESVLVAMRSGEEIGWGEVSLGAAPLESSEWSAGGLACLRDWLAPAVVGRTITSGGQIREILQPFEGNHRAKAAIDLAWHDLKARAENQPLYRLLGGRKAPIAVSACLGVMDSIDALVAAIGATFESGYEMLTLKVRPGWDVHMLRAVRQVFPSERIAIDCDGLCTLADREMFYRMQDFHLEHIEQPLAADDLVGHAMLQESLRTPICLHQSIASQARVEQAIDLGSCRIMRIEPANVGGLAPALAIRSLCEAAEISCAAGGGRQGILATAATLALATLPNFSVPADDWPLDVPEWIATDARQARSPEPDGAGKLRFMLGEAPGAGAALDREMVARLAIEHALAG